MAFGKTGLLENSMLRLTQPSLAGLGLSLAKVYFLKLGSCLSHIAQNHKVLMFQMSGVKVAVRVRPFNSREVGRSAECIISMEGATTSKLHFFLHFYH